MPNASSRAYGIASTAGRNGALQNKEAVMGSRQWHVVAAVCGIALSLQTSAQQQAPVDGPRFVNGTSLIRPADYREWIFLSSGVGMSYDPVVGDPPAG